jgi:histidine triad (HIT) family protein
MFPASDSCIFCRIVKGELPSTRVYEDDALFAFFDINPISLGHTLLIPKGHYATLLDVPANAAALLLPAAQRIGKALMAATKCAGFNCLQNNFAAAGQIVFHSHIHIIPRMEGDGLKQWPHNAKIDAAAVSAVAEAIRPAL